MIKVCTRAAVAVLLAACAGAPYTDDQACANETFSIDAEFAGGDLDKCRFTSPDSVELTFLPEDQSVDDAFSWFSFRVIAEEPREIRIKLQFPRAYARYWPKVSDDGVTWARAASDSTTIVDAGKSVSLFVTADADGTWVSAQELLTLAYYDRWFEELRAHDERGLVDFTQVMKIVVWSCKQHRTE